MTPELIVIGVLVALLIGFSKGGFGGAAGGFSTPLLILVLAPEKVIGLLLPILIAADLWSLRVYWGAWNPSLVRLLMPPAVIGIVVGTLFLAQVSGDTLRVSLGVVIFVLALFKWVEPMLKARQTYQPRAWHSPLAGLVAGFSSALAHAGGPPAVAFLLYQGLTPRMLVATSVVFFAVINLVKVPFYLAAGLFDIELLLSMSWMVLLLPLGIALGSRFAARVSMARFNKIISVALLISALGMIFS